MSKGRFASLLLRALFGNTKRTLLSIAVIFLGFLLLITGALFQYVASGGLTARRKPLALESYFGRRAVDLSIPRMAILQQSPLRPTREGADALAGRALYQKQCDVCHGFDGSGRTEAGGGLYPPPADLRDRVTAGRTDGALFYLIRNGIRNTGMPGWQLTDQQTWQLVLHIRNLPSTASIESSTRGAGGATAATYVGSVSCKNCHAVIYERWKTTLMANVVRDPRHQPDAILPDLSRPDPLVNFSIEDIAFVYGKKWKQRYFKKIGDDYFPLPAQWDVTQKLWRPYFVKDDWWVRYYPPDNMKRPTGPTCDGCHSVNYDIVTKSVTEWNVGCERCHGPGSEHVQRPLDANIVNPARLDYVQANDACIQCHSQGRPLSNPIDGKYYDWPVGFQMGLKLSDYWRLEEHKLGENSFTHFGDGTAHKNRMQGNDFVTSQMYTHGVTCFTCHDPHGSSIDSLLRKPANQICLDCHGENSSNGPREGTLEEHTHHKPGTPGSECIACHMPKIAQTLGDVNVRSHTFRFVGPAKTEALKIPNACNVCHTDKSTAWTAEILKRWSNRSPWRMEQ